MSKVSIIIPKRDRSEFLKICLHYLNICCANKRFDVNVYIVDDSIFADNPDITYPNFKCLTYLPIPHLGKFNKSKLINYALSKMDDFDLLSIIDCDMIYDEDFLDSVYRNISLGAGYVVSHGYKLGKNLSDYIALMKPNLEYIKGSSDKEEFKVGPSQISMTRSTYKMFIDTFGSPLYDPYYEGWGAEDSDLSFKSMFLSSRNLLSKVELLGVWYHLYHESRNTDPVQYNKNYDHLKDQLSKYCASILKSQGGIHV